MSSWILEATLLILVLLSIVVWSIAVTKVWFQWKEGQKARSFLQGYREVKSWADAAAFSANGASDFGAVACAGFSVCRSLKDEEGAGMAIADLRESIERALRMETYLLVRRREWGMAVMASVGSVSPFIGLFGTVLGIMNAMKTISATGQASIDVVAGPIGEALVTTAVGIATAVPAVLAYNYFLRQKRLWISDLDVFSAEFLRAAIKHRSEWCRL